MIEVFTLPINPCQQFSDGAEKFRRNGASNFNRPIQSACERWIFHHWHIAGSGNFPNAPRHLIRAFGSDDWGGMFFAVVSQRDGKVCGIGNDDIRARNFSSNLSL
jgi:hypothetical protein